MKTKFLATIIAIGITSVVVGSFLYIDEPKTAWDCRQKYGKVSQDIQNCLDEINQKFSVIPPVYASCIVNEDWPKAPCLDTIANGKFDQGQVNRWSDYYFYKGAETMEQKFQELSEAIKQDRLEEWIKESHENLNVYQYYFFSGRAPAIVGFNAAFDIIPINEEFENSPIIKIGIGQKIQLDDLKLYFYDIEDSRCPLDVECIWEGEVTVMINLDNKTLDASTYFTPGRTVTFPPYEITMTDIQPHPISTEKPDYVATLEATKLDVQPDPEQFRGETLQDTQVIIIIQSLGAILIASFIILYAIKKRRKKNEN